MNVRTGRHDRFDRTVFDFTDGTPGYRVEYGTLLNGAIRVPMTLEGPADLVGFRVFQLHSPDRVVVDVAHQPTRPFGYDTVWLGDAGADTVIKGVRTGRHPGYDRLVFDLGTAQVPLVFVAYRTGTSTIVVGFSGRNVPALVSGPRTVHVGLPRLRGVSIQVYENGTASAFVTTASRHGFRVMVLYQPTRLVVDMAHS